MITVKEISAEDTYRLRHKSLSQNQSMREYHYQGDHLDTTFHLGAFENQKIAGIASFYMETTNAIHSHKQFRLRGLEIPDQDQSLRIATTLLHKANRILYHGNVEYIWCIVKTAARPFYERMGFSPAGETFEIDPSGSQVILYKEVEKP
ncbi:Acetyltransferase (GNAT) domain-containing protein [Thalassobacillus cyri]|uniref:Acetyltransferase (GNAT) domain-containing protein n=1 Tax=Thalassobacillus cyri TaxID=571932 RepID=A0A1H4CD25_9BACI|nr:GNAT family N-acetyltransferase [Thalassobacillus cyri]SEA58223.1 Acetyltransferase (GNAT) domain-containing protein [Thalassobacillus cyri]